MDAADSAAPTTAVPEASRAPGLLGRLADVRPAEARAVGWAFGYFASLLGGYYVLRAVREEMGIRGGVERLHESFLATFLVMLAAVPLYSALVARVPRASAIPLVYRAFLACLLGFLALVALGVAPALTARAFYVWVSVYGLFVVSVFWSYLADLFTSEQGKRLFGFVAAGGSAGAIGGPLLATVLVGQVGVPGLLAVAAAPTLVVVTLVQALRRVSHYAVERPSREVLFTVVGRGEKYQAKGFIDTIVYRGGDALSAQGAALLAAAGLGLGATALAAAPFCVAWLALVAWVRRRHGALEAAR